MATLTPPELLAPDIQLPDLELPAEDGIPLESNWHRIEMNLLIDSIHHYWQARDDYFVGGNMFLYFSLEQARNRDYRGPDFFLVKNVDGTQPREAWVVWEEQGRYPDVIIELASPSTIEVDLGLKKKLYEQTFHTSEYFCYDPNSRRLMGWRWAAGGYTELAANEQGRLWSQEVQAWVGLWEGQFQKMTATWLRFYTEAGQLVLTKGEGEAERAETEAQRAEAEAQRAEAEAQRAEAAEAEAARLRALLAKHNIAADDEVTAE